MILRTFVNIGGGITSFVRHVFYGVSFLVEIYVKDIEDLCRSRQGEGREEKVSGNDSIKKVYLKNLIKSIDIVNKQNELDEVKEITFFTSFGFIVGELYEIVEIEAETFDEMKEEIRPMVQDNKLNAINMADWLTKQIINMDDNNIEGNDDVLILKDVKIYNYTNSNLAKSNFFILFLDQVIGVIPTKTTVERR